MAEAEGHYDNLDLQQRDDAIYDDLNARPRPRVIPPSDTRQNKRVGVGVGLLVAVLVLLNVAVPLYLHQSYKVEKEQLEISYNNLTKERDQLLDRNNHLTLERDDMKSMLCESPGWQKFDRGCYYISTGRKTWEESRQWCNDRQSHLIVIKRQRKQDFVVSFNKRVWLGLTDTEREGSFQWVDGTPLTTPTYWMPGAPDNKEPTTNEEADCVEYYDGSQPGFPARGWNDGPCSTSINYWICERVLC